MSYNGHKSLKGEAELMANLDKVLERILNGRSDNNIAFDDLRNVLDRLGFRERIKGDHHMFTKTGVREILNLQPQSNGTAKPYQVKQVRDVLKDYGLLKLP